MAETMHHPIFDIVPGYRGVRPANILMDYVGAQFRGKWDGQEVVPRLDPFICPKPVFDEEYFEWVDIIDSVLNAHGRFVMLELGAGYGRWGIRGGLAARTQGIKDIHLVFAEAEPQHAAWLREALALNGLEKESQLVERAVAYTSVWIPFVVRYRREEGGDFEAGNWFGQMIGWEDRSEPVPGPDYHGYSVYRTPAGHDQIFVETVTLEDLTRDLSCIDLIDMDLQKAERELVANSMDTLNAKVKRVHIGTHSPEIEDELRAAFTKAGWKNVWDHGCNQTNDTLYGPIAFNDGVQGWVNPRVE